MRRDFGPALVLGAGNFGTCLAQHLAEQGHSVTLWTRSADVAKSIQTMHKNPKYLNTITLSNRIKATDKIDDKLLGDASFVVIAIPTQFMREVLTKLAPSFHEDLLIICAAKGIEVGTNLLPIEIIRAVLGDAHADSTVFLSGPSFAVEIVNHEPTAVVVGSKDRSCCRDAQQIFHAPHFRTYRTDDPVGLEVAGALKNVIAIAAGACAGLGFQANSRASVITRGLAEMTRVGVAMGANPLTFNGLGGVGDLFLTASSEKSRNFTVGYRLGRGDTLKTILETMGSVAEGVATAKAAHELAAKLNVEVPIIDEVYEVLYEGKPIVQAVTDLLTREAGSEQE